MHELVAGDRVDQYELTELLARSGMASIFKAVDRSTGMTVALKVPHLQYESGHRLLPALRARGEDRPEARSSEHRPRALAREEEPHVPGHGARGGQVAPRRPGRGADGRRQGARPDRADRQRARLPALARHRSPRSEAGQRDAHGRRQDQAARLRHRDGRSGAAPHLVRADAPRRHARLHGARAGARQARRREDGHLRARHDALRDDHRGAAVPARQRPRRRCGRSSTRIRGLRAR